MMRTKRIITAGAVAAFAISAGLSAQQERAPQPGQQQPQQQQQQQERPGEVGAMGQERAQQEQQAHRLSDLEEATVQSQDGEELGRVDDLAIDVENGQLGFLLVSNGEGALHPVPPEALQISGGQQDLQIELNIDRENWEDAPSVEREEVAQLDQQSDEIYEFFGEERQAQEQEERTLQLASELKEITLLDENQEEIGNISDFLINVEEGEVPFALLQPRRAEEEYAVATRALQMESEDEISLHVTREDFEQVETLSLQDVQQKAQEQQQMEVAQLRQSPELYRFQEDEAVFGARPQRQQQQQQQQEGGADIRVQQPAPEVEVHQPAPDVQVRQPETEVQVETAEPEVEVRQPDPQVEVDQQEPEVRVQQQEPEVHVEQDEPDVEIERQEEERDRDDDEEREDRDQR